MPDDPSPCASSSRLSSHSTAVCRLSAPATCGSAGWLKLGRVDNRTSILPQATEHFHEHGYVVLPGYLSEHDLAPAHAELELMFPTAEEYHAGANPARNARFTGGAGPTTSTISPRGGAAR